MTLGYDLQNKGMWNEINVYWCFCVFFLVREVEINLQIKVNIREEQVKTLRWVYGNIVLRVFDGVFSSTGRGNYSLTCKIKAGMKTLFV